MGIESHMKDIVDVNNPEKKKGFDKWTPAQRAEVSSKGGKAAHAKGAAHEFTSEEAREAGRKGGRASAAKKRARKEGGA